MEKQVHQPFFAGIDIGSTMSKAVILNNTEKICAYVIGPTGAEHRRQADSVMREVLAKADIKLEQVVYIVSTGYGRVNVPFADKQVTELTCHAKGVASIFPDVRTAIDIGGQDAKVLKIRDGKLIDFLTNDKCAAGTGRFLEVAAETLGLNLDEMGSISMQAGKPVKINSLCTIFAQQEIVSRLSENQPLSDILAGVYIAIATRVVKLARQLKVEPPVVFTGGVARNAGMVKAIQAVLGMPVLIPDEPLITGALGAALIARQNYLQLIREGTFLTRKRELGAAKIDFMEETL